MPLILLEVVKTLAPIFLSALNHYQKAHPGETPTREQLIDTLTRNGDVILAEGAAWVPNPNG